MSLTYTFTSADLDVSKVVDPTQYDKQPFIQQKGFTYYSYYGRLLSLTPRYDMRPGLVFGVAVTADGVMFHVPQYRKTLKVAVKIANLILRKSRLYYSSFYQEV